MTPSPEDFTTAELADMLRAHAQGSHLAAAAAELLIRHNVWLHRGDFVRDHVHVEPAPWMTGDSVWARIDWESAIDALNAGVLPCSGSERRILLIAASIGFSVAIDLSDCLTSLDQKNVERVITAIRHANRDPDAWSAHDARTDGRHRRGGSADDRR